MRLGFIGTGIITSALITGLCRSGQAPARILVSPRNPEKAAALSASFPQVQVAADNQSVVDGSDIVVLAVTSQVAQEVIAALRFRADQRVISLMALFSLSQLTQLVAPASTICRVVPLPPVARGVGPIVQCPTNLEVGALLEPIGTVVVVDDETQLNKFTAVTALMAPFYEMLGRTQSWLAGQGLDDQVASRYVSALFHGLALDATKVDASGFGPIVADAQTPGGLNEEALGRLRQAGWYDQIDQVLDAILARVSTGITAETPSEPRE